MNWRDRIGQVKYNVGFNLSDSNNELVYMEQISDMEAGKVAYTEGYAVNSYWMYKTDGFFADQAEADAYSYRNGKNITAGSNIPGDEDWVNNWVYNPEYPIYAMRTSKPSEMALGRRTESAQSADGTDLYESISDGRGVETGDYLDNGKVLYWDMSADVTSTTLVTDEVSGKTGSAIWRSFFFQGGVFDASAGWSEWNCDWFITFRSIEELEAYIANGN